MQHTVYLDSHVSVTTCEQEVTSDIPTYNSVHTSNSVKTQQIFLISDAANMDSCLSEYEDTFMFCVLSTVVS